MQFSIRMVIEERITANNVIFCCLHPQYVKNKMEIKEKEELKVAKRNHLTKIALFFVRLDLMKHFIIYNEFSSSESHLEFYLRFFANLFFHQRYFDAVSSSDKLSY